MSQPKVVVFDLGKVFLDFDYTIAARRIAARSRLTPEQVLALINHSPLIYKFECGQISRHEAFAELQRLTEFAGTATDLIEAFCDVFTPIEPMIELNRLLRKRNVPTYIFSNTNEVTIEFIRRRYPFFAEFDGYVFSYEHGAMKPDPRLYEVVERLTGKCGREIFYLDDLPQNVAAGAARGWQAVVHETPEKSRDAVRAAGLL
ncbi:MAG: HAD family phosphatase [Verrucomicrobiae bacterium]|nr:HAD family phosphatase [Verrucomicrobiae bacterium]MCX7722393.1 HAD family phosphatase [Verrucomicrobiae bacterium]MDW7979737.1 HAD family phosphatase [Verrucomicrobiales bacterium]